MINVLPKSSTAAVLRANSKAPGQQHAAVIRPKFRNIRQMRAKNNREGNIANFRSAVLRVSQLKNIYVDSRITQGSVRAISRWTHS